VIAAKWVIALELPVYVMNSPDPSPTEFLGDPLSALARAERRNLLVASVVGFMVAEAGLVPQQISALGVTFSALEQDVLLLLMAAVILYFLAAFVVVGLADFFVWRKQYQDYLESVLTRVESWSEQDQRDYDQRRGSVPNVWWLYSLAGPVACLRQAFEYALPVVLGLIVITLLTLKAQ
jgi:hypothetical protein